MIGRETEKRYSPTMARKLVVVPSKSKGSILTTDRSEILISVGGERFAIDFTAVLSEINPVETEILSIDRGKLSPKRKGSARPSDK